MHTKELDKLYNPKTVEDKWSSYWLEKELFKADADSGKPVFSVFSSGNGPVIPV